jgi:hypothetical protein
MPEHSCAEQSRGGIPVQGSEHPHVAPEGLRKTVALQLLAQRLNIYNSYLLSGWVSGCINHTHATHTVHFFLSCTS